MTLHPTVPADQEAALWTSCPTCDARPGEECKPREHGELNRRRRAGGCHGERVQAAARDRLLVEGRSPCRTPGCGRVARKNHTRCRPCEERRETS